MRNPFLHKNEVNIFSNPLEFRISKIEENGSNVHHIFYANYINYIANFHFDYIVLGNEKKGQYRTADLLYYNLLHATLIVDRKEYIDELSLIESFALEEYNFYINDSNPKAQIYWNFINNNLFLFRKIDTLILYFIKRRNITTFSQLVKEKINSTLIDSKKIDIEIRYFLNTLSELYATDIVHYNSIPQPIDTKRIYNTFNLEFLLTPTLLLTEEQLTIYRNALLKWLEYIQFEFKKIYFPDFEHPLFDFVKNSIKKHIDINSPFPKEEIKQLDNMTPETTNKFPNYIFKDYPAYLLFHTIASQVNTHPDISFLYRQMAEWEKPKLIIANMIQFRDWYNEQNYPLNYLDSFKTMEQAKKCGREQYYYIIKLLINKD